MTCARIWHAALPRCRISSGQHVAVVVTEPVQARQQLLDLFHSAIAAVHGRTVVRQALLEQPLDDAVSVVALGKAAPAMLEGALEVLGARLQRALLVSKAGHADTDMPRDPRIEVLHGDHPVPGNNSLAAGRALLEFISRTPQQDTLLFLVSGGTSSLVEVPREDIGLDTLQHVNRWLLGSGLDICSVNAVRQALSAIKGGRLLDVLGTRAVRVLLMSDVPGDDPAIIGSGLLFPVASHPDSAALPDWLLDLLAGAEPVSTGRRRIEHRIIASAGMAQAAAAAQARELGCPARVMDRPLSGDVSAAAGMIAGALAAAGPGVLIWGGETTVVLPEQPGNGGRNQQLALCLVAQGLSGSVVLVAGSDGDDGNNGAAGATVDAGSRQRMLAHGCQPRDCLRRADAATCLTASGDLLVTGPTGTNVMDLVIGMKLPTPARP